MHVRSFTSVVGLRCFVGSRDFPRRCLLLELVFYFVGHDKFEKLDSGRNTARMAVPGPSYLLHICHGSSRNHASVSFVLFFKKCALYLWAATSMSPACSMAAAATRMCPDPLRPGVQQVCLASLASTSKTPACSMAAAATRMCPGPLRPGDQKACLATSFYGHGLESVTIAMSRISSSSAFVDLHH